jgi:hypothetical protein
MRSLTFACSRTPYPPWSEPYHTDGSPCGGFQGRFTRGLAAQELWNISYKFQNDSLFLTQGSSYQSTIEQALQSPGVDLAAGLAEIPSAVSPNACPGICPGNLASFPLYTTFQSVLLLKVRAADDFSRLFSPFEYQVYLAAVATMVTLAACLVALRVINPRTCKEYKVNVRSFTDAFYHSVLATLGGEDDSAPWPKGPTRIIRIVSVFFTLVLTAAYTANLAAFFTAPSVSLVGPQSMEELGDATVCVPLDLTAPLVRPFAKRVIIPPTSSLDGDLGLNAAITWCHEAIVDADRADADRADALISCNLQYSNRRVHVAVV